MHIARHYIQHYYRGYTSVSKASSTDQRGDLDFVFDLLEFIVPELYSSSSGISGLNMAPHIKNAGSEGVGRVIDKLLSMRTTELMVGLSTTFS